VHDLLTNPVYAGVYVFGRSRQHISIARDGQVKITTVAVAMQDWQVCLPDHHPGYVSWDQYLDTQARLRANVRARR
jgi:hypothetical protein